MTRTRTWPNLALAAVLLATLVPATTSMEPRPAAGVNVLDPAAVWASTDGFYTYAVAWGDWDGDGDLDLAVGNDARGGGDADGGVCIYENSGGWLENAASWCAFEQDNTQDLAWGDWDNDGDLDLAVANYQGHNRIYENEGDTMTLVWTAEGSDYNNSVAWGDVDGDGDLDLAVASGSAVQVYENYNGQGLGLYWSDPADYNYGSVAWGDWDNDGDPDLAVGKFDEPILVYQNNNGHLDLAWTAPAAEGTYSVAWGDLDRDGNLDLAVANSGGGGVRFYHNTGGNLLGYWAFADEKLSYSVAWGDWDGDGDVDPAFGNRTFQPIIVHESNGWCYIDPVWYSEEDSGPGYSSVAWGDWNDDGDLDLAVGNTTQPSRVYENLGATIGTGAVWSSTPREEPTYALAWGDWESDGDLDLAVGNDGQPVRIYENDGGTLRVQWSAPASASTHSLAWGDWDGDGDLDLAVGNLAHPSQLYENEGGVMTLAWTSPGISATTSLAWGDWDGDGDLDLAVGNSDQRNQVYRNAGNTLALAWVSQEQEDTTSVAWGDFDGDMLLDLAAGNRDQNVRVYKNDGSDLDSFWNSSTPRTTTSVAWGDWDGDGDLDLAVGNSGQPCQVYENDGSTFILDWTAAESAATHAVAWADMNGDGDLDLAAANMGQPNAIYENIGPGLEPVAVWKSQESDNSTSLAWGDWDGDGDLDLVFGNLNQPIRRYQNNYIAPPALPNTPPSIVIDRPGQTDQAYFYASAEILTGNLLPIHFRLHDHEGDTVTRIVARYSTNGGGHWQPATVFGDTTMLAASPTGTEHVLIWNALADGARGDNVVFRLISVQDNPTHIAAPIQRATMGAATLPMRIRPQPVLLSPFRQLRVGLGGQMLAHRLNLLNNTGRSATFALFYQSREGWPVAGPAQVEIGDQMSTEFPIIVTVPVTASIGTLDIITVTAAALHNPVLFHSQAYLFTYKGAPAANLDIGKAAPVTVEAGAVMTYTLVARNAGAGPVGGIVITETLPANVSFAWASEGGTYSPTLRTVVWKNGLLFAGRALTVTVAVTAGCVPSGTLIVNDTYAATCDQCSTPVYGPSAATKVRYTPPTAGFALSASEVEVGSIVTVTNTSQYATAYLWNWGDGSTTRLARPQHTYAEPGDYTVTLTAANRCGADQASAAINVVLLLEAGFENDAFVCVGSPIGFTNTTTGTPPITYLWDFADGITSTLEHPSHVYAAPGDYMVTLQATNAARSDIASGVVLALPAPTAAFTYSVSGLRVQFSNAAIFAGTFLWDFGDGGTSAARNPSHTYAVAGIYDVTLTATGPCGSAVAAMPVAVEIAAPYRIFLPLVTRG